MRLSHVLTRQLYERLRPSPCQLKFKMANAGHTSEGICAKYIIHPKRILVVACARLAIRIRPNGSGQIYSISTLLKVRIITAVVDV